MFNLSVNYIVSLNISHQQWNGRKWSKEDENPSKSVHNLNCTWCSFPPATVECVVFIITYFYSLIFIKFMTICAFLWLGKLCFQFTNIICVMAQFRHEGKLEGGVDFGSLYSAINVKKLFYYYLCFIWEGQIEHTDIDELKQPSAGTIVFIARC